MKLFYYPETDSLYIELSEKVSVDSREAAPGVVLDFDSKGCLVGINIDQVSRITEISRVVVSSLPAVEFVSGS
ncbi:MAG: DUF2283 domain-containing protein [Firmicutes bacterium]|nr:DUF2283 domain-containing protein [Bacillota bacterium]